MWLSSPSEACAPLFGPGVLVVLRDTGMVDVFLQFLGRCQCCLHLESRAMTSHLSQSCQLMYPAVNRPEVCRRARMEGRYEDINEEETGYIPARTAVRFSLMCMTSALPFERAGSFVLFLSVCHRLLQEVLVPVCELYQLSLVWAPERQ